MATICTFQVYAPASEPRFSTRSIVEALPASSAGESFTVSTEKTRDIFGNRGFILGTMVGGKQKHFVLQSMVERPKALVSINSSTAVLIGDANGVTQAFTIFNPSTGEIKLQVPCEFLALSPDKSKIAFVRFFAPHFAPLYTSSAVYAFYRLADLRLHDDSSIHDDAGTRVYPTTDVRKSVNSELGVHRLKGSIEWSSDSSFTFVDSFEGYASKIRVTVGQSMFNERVVNTIKENRAP